jgi:hypothetical protein
MKELYRRESRGVRERAMENDADNAEKRLRRVSLPATSVQVTDGAIRMRYAGLWGTLALRGVEPLPSELLIHLIILRSPTSNIFFGSSQVQLI